MTDKTYKELSAMAKDARENTTERQQNNAATVVEDLWNNEALTRDQLIIIATTLLFRE